MKKPIKTIFATAIAFAFSFVLFSCSTEKNADTLRMNMVSEPDSFFPWKSAAAETAAVTDNIFEGLLKFDEKGSLYPALAENWSISEDFLTYTFNLRKGVKFHNGVELTSEDCLYTYKNLAGLDGLSPQSDKMLIVKSVSAPDKYTFIVELKSPYSAFLMLASDSPILLKDYSENEKFPIGTGPYKFVSYSLHEKITLQKNDEYYDKQRSGKIKNIEIYIMTDENASISALQSGQLDIVQMVTGINAKALEGRYNVISHPQNMVQILGLNNFYPPLSDINVRKAITCAIDKQEIINGVFDGFATPLYSNFSPILAEFYNDKLSKLFVHDIQKAKDYMARSNYKNGFDLAITVPANYQPHVDTAQLIANQLKSLGINCTIVPVEWTTWLEKVYTKFDYQSTVIGFAGKIDPAEVLRRYCSNYKRNFTNFKNAEYDEIFNKAENEIELKKRAQYFKDCQEILTKECAAVFICDPGRNIVTTKNIAGYTPYPVSMYDFSKIYFIK
ncbi:ABC transporter substrate-binding protein [Treponema pectinovorum]|uniref:ABC transporter substrate-binding protein n=1 Tax=Treponema pectinovorum TaxID=164 RepID=UPI003D936A8D